jgi:2,3-bisphosphoglycerate-dependent phosphoglycerate mutase
MKHTMKTRICFIRHGETDWNVAHRIQGQTDVPLNETGRSQALAMAFNAAHYDFSAIYSSDLMRAFDTAEVVAKGRVLEVVPLVQLRERHFGIFQGLTATEGLQLNPAAHACYIGRDLEYDFELGESILDFSDRIEQAVNDLIKHHPDQTLAVVSHAGVLEIVYRKATGRPLHTPRDFAIPNCALNWFSFDAHGWHLESWDDHHHLTKVLKESAD